MKLIYNEHVIQRTLAISHDPLQRSELISSHYIGAKTKSEKLRLTAGVL